MNYSYKIISPQDFKVSQWSGGLTTEMYIYPTSSTYKDKNFIFRISSATVDLEHTTFTHLPNIYRYICTLKGCLGLRHNNVDKVITLNPFQIHHFHGDCPTESFGKVIDFNLMYHESCVAELNNMNINHSPKAISYPSTFTNNFKMLITTFYSPEETIEITIDNNETVLLPSNSLLVLNLEPRIFPPIELKSSNYCNVLISHVILAS